MEERSDLLGTLTGEALMLTLLGKLLYVYPDGELIAPLLGEDLFAEAPFAADQPDVNRGLALLQSWSKEARKLDSDAVVQELRCDYTRLFIGVGKVLAPPWESVHLSEGHAAFQKETLQVRGCYRQYGLQSESLYNEPDDHVGLELVFLSHLAKLQFEAITAGDRDRAASLAGFRKQFLETHVMRWVPTWTRQVLENASSDFYRGLALLTAGTLSEMAGLMGLDQVNGAPAVPSRLGAR